ncbi:hypothetical protein BGZ83_006480 [Gryganskiella cystojenkinii]|nr:hypothetical protein BGZ83_006480 [Gryganskiella cystojenkinii]
MNGNSSSANPILVLEPTNNSFAIKSLELPEQSHIKIGRQTGVTTSPQPTNGYFDSKVLSRVHAEVWAENGKVYIRDLKSSNGTFLNGRRLCPENVESDPFVLNQNDNLEFGIDILDENGSLLHEKVACKIYISRMNGYSTSKNGTQESLVKSKSGSPNGSIHNSGSTTTVVTSGGQSTNIDLIISRLQSELSRSQETNSDLGVLKQGLGELERALVTNAASEDGQTTTKAAIQDSNAAAEYQKLLEQNTQAHEAEIALMKKQSEATQAELDAYIQKTQLMEPLIAEDEILRRDLAQSIAELTSVKLERDLAKDSMNEMINDHQQAMECLRREHESAVALLEASHKENMERFVCEAAETRDLLAAKHHQDLAEALQAVPQPVVNFEETEALEKRLSELDVESKLLQSTLESLSKQVQTLEVEKSTLANELHETKTELTTTTKNLKEAEIKVTRFINAEEDLALMTPTSPTNSTTSRATKRQNGQTMTTTTTTTRTSGPKGVVSRSEFWAQVFPSDKKQLNQPSTFIVSGGIILVGLGAYVLWNKSGR